MARLKPLRAAHLGPRLTLLLLGVLLAGLLLQRPGRGPAAPGSPTLSAAQQLDRHLRQASVAARPQAQAEVQAALDWQACLTPAEARQVTRRYPALHAPLQREAQLLVTPPACPTSAEDR